ncbi:MAG: rRNA maturation RNase YbeY [Armatimonadetes bacterium]|nr:rRNA maturation RNase YbeY [Armatimonadota bacterium]NOG37991.1 rRNA maturation RNase YbeY [Armatimonadota bacterium]GIK31879.1 MAG: hypothetical protein BroJett009_08710 [Armatimonadota bacterium]
MEPPSTHRIEVLDITASGVSLGLAVELVRAVLGRHCKTPRAVELVLASGEKVRELNRRFRALDSDTDVLSFPAAPLPGPPSAERALGEIVVSWDMALHQAALRGVEPELEIAWLALHGALHLVGFDDESEADRVAMLAEMNSIAQDQGLDPQQDWSSIYAESQGVES